MTLQRKRGSEVIQPGSGIAVLQRIRRVARHGWMYLFYWLIRPMLLMCVVIMVFAVFGLRDFVLIYPALLVAAALGIPSLLIHWLVGGHLDECNRCGALVKHRSFGLYGRRKWSEYICGDCVKWRHAEAIKARRQKQHEHL